MSAFLTALGSGVSAKKILDYIMRKSPEFAPRIQSALASGLSAEKIISFFKKEKNFEKLRNEMQSEYSLENNANPIVQGENIRSNNLATDMASGLQRQLPKALGTAAALGTSYALGRAIPPILQATGIMNPKEPIQTQLQIQENQPSQPPILPQIATNITQPQTVAQPEGIINPKEYLEKLGLKEKVDELLKLGNPPEAIAAALGIKRSGEAKIDPELLKNIESYAQEKQATPQEQPSIQPTGEKLDVPKEENQRPKAEKIKGVTPEKPTINKGSIALSPQGIGEIKELRNGQALIDVDGKLHKVKEEELEGEPEEVKNATLDFDPNSVPEDLRSAPLNEVYTPADRRHVTVKYNAGLKPVRYIYFRKDGQPIDESYVDKIKKGIQLPVSSGKSFWGTWNADESDSRGAANYEELVSNAQEEGEPDDPTKEYWFIKEEALYEHPYLEKAGKEQLRAMEKEFNEKNKKPRKKKKA